MKTVAQRLGILALALALSIGGSGARADVIHAGVSVDAIVPAGMVRTRVDAPSELGMPVRVVLSSSAQGRPELMVDVLVTSSTRAARATFEQQARTRSSRMLPALAGVGDRAVGGGRFVLFARDNVVVAVLGARLDSDVVDAARHVDAAVRAAPNGAATATRITARWDDRTLTQRGATPLVLEGDVVASEVSVTSGPARVRRTTDGWLLMRRAPGAFTLQIVSVDSQLRVAAR